MELEAWWSSPDQKTRIWRSPNMPIKKPGLRPANMRNKHPKVFA